MPNIFSMNIISAGLFADTSF